MIGKMTYVVILKRYVAKWYFAIIALVAIGLIPLSLPAYGTVSTKHEVSVSEPTMTTKRGIIEFSCPADGRTYTFQIYSITGQLLKKITVSEATVAVEIARGCYIVKCESWVKKALVG